MAEAVAAATGDTPVTRSPAKPWHQRRDENALWYCRFLRYVALGPSRSISLVSRGRRNAYPVPAHWPIQASQLDWRARAQAFDEAAMKNSKIILEFEQMLVKFTDAAPPRERELMRGLRYTPPEDDPGELMDFPTLSD